MISFPVLFHVLAGYYKVRQNYSQVHPMLFMLSQFEAHEEKRKKKRVDEVNIPQWFEMNRALVVV